MTFKKWVDAIGGPHQAARLIGCSRFSIHRWINRERTPKSKHMRKIISLSKGSVSPFDLISKERK